MSDIKACDGSGRFSQCDCPTVRDHDLKACETELEKATARVEYLERLMVEWAKDRMPEEFVDYMNAVAALEAEARRIAERIACEPKTSAAGEESGKFAGGPTSPKPPAAETLEA